MAVVENADPFDLFGIPARKESWTISTVEENGVYRDILTNNLTAESSVLRSYPKPAPRRTFFEKLRKYF